MVSKSYSPCTFRTYLRNLKNFKIFLASLHPTEELPATPLLLAEYIHHLSRMGKKSSTILSYVTGITTLHKLLYNIDPSDSFLVRRVLKATKSVTPVSSKLLPISFRLLGKIIHQLANLKLDRYSKAAAKALFTLAYYGCFRIGELLYARTQSHSLTIDNLALSLNTVPRSLTITLPSFKFSTAPASLELLENASSSCPVQAVLNFLSLRPKKEGLFFIDKGCNPYTREQASTILKACL